MQNIEEANIQNQRKKTSKMVKIGQLNLETGIRNSAYESLKIQVPYEVFHITISGWIFDNFESVMLRFKFIPGRTVNNDETGSV